MDARRSWWLLVLLFTMVPAAAESRRDSPPPHGEAVRRWLDLQRQPRAERGAPSLPGDIAVRIYDRYAASFSHPLPETYERQRFVTED